MRQSEKLSDPLLPSKVGRVTVAQWAMGSVMVIAILVTLLLPGTGRAEPAEIRSTSLTTQPTRASVESLITPPRPVNAIAAGNQAVLVQIVKYLALPPVQNHLLLESLKAPSPWDGVARCETGGDWSMTGGSFSGGLGFANSTYSSFVHGLTPSGERRWNDLVGDFHYPENAGEASREQEIVVAERIKEWNGGTPVGAWGCGGYYGS